jgi:hypothetical protein
MANNRYLDVIKRVLTSEAYLRWREEAKEREEEQRRRRSKGAMTTCVCALELGDRVLEAFSQPRLRFGAPRGQMLRRERR